MRHLNRENLAWLAGIICGEGSFSLHRPRRWVGIRFSVGQAGQAEEKPEMLSRIQNILGMGKVYRCGPMNPRHKPAWQFLVVKFEEVQAIVAMTWNWLTPEKQEQAARMLRDYALERQILGTKNYAL